MNLEEIVSLRKIKRNSIISRKERTKKEIFSIDNEEIQFMLLDYFYNCETFYENFVKHTELSLYSFNEVSKDKERVKKLINEIYDVFEDILNFDDYNFSLLDSDIMEFNGDIVITDPCYTDVKSIKKCSDFYTIHKKNIRSTLYGDWSCTVYDIDTEDKIGKFCADSGMVGVFLLNDILEYNPNYDYKADVDNDCTTLIKNFKGKVQFIVNENVKEEEDEHYCVHVVGCGIDSKTGKDVNFISRQTGF